MFETLLIMITVQRRRVLITPFTAGRSNLSEIPLKKKKKKEDKSKCIFLYLDLL